MCSTKRVGYPFRFGDLAGGHIPQTSTHEVFVPAETAISRASGSFVLADVFRADVRGELRVLELVGHHDPVTDAPRERGEDRPRGDREAGDRRASPE